VQTVLDETSDRAGAERHESDHARLTRLIRQEGLLHRRPSYRQALRHLNEVGTR
jgi:hypothetical protein